MLCPTVIKLFESWFYGRKAIGSMRGLSELVAFFVIYSYGFLDVIS
jgi:hypothetical protein